jgi:hypothetical protein
MIGAGHVSWADLAEIRRLGRKMFGMRLVTPPTGPQGKPVNRILVEEAVPVVREFRRPVFFAGQLPKPPLEMRGRVESMIKHYDRSYIQSCRYTPYRWKKMKEVRELSRRCWRESKEEPSGFSSLMPLYSGGLWEAVIMMPASNSRVIKASVGVGKTPAS